MLPYYNHGGIKIYHGDCLEVLPELGLESLGVGAVVTDPPYGIAHVSNAGGNAPWKRTRIAGDQDVSVRDAALDMLCAYPALVFGTWKTPPPKHAHAALIWDKGAASGMGDLSVPWKPSWEMVFVIGHGFRGRRDEGVLKGLTGLTWFSKGRAHPHEKPVRLMVALLVKCPRGLILDPFMGSGTTLAAAKQTGRPAVGVELDERWCEAAARRLEQEVLDFTPDAPETTEQETLPLTGVTLCAARIMTTAK